MKTYLLSFLSSLFLGFLAISPSYATHLRAGEITTRRVSNTSLTYEVTLTTYHDEIGGKTASDQQDDVPIFCFGVGGPRSIPRIEQRSINSATTINIYRTTFTYPGPGTYNITCTITNRNQDVRNVPGSVNTSFQLRTTIVVNPGLGLNSTPILLNPPLDSARIGQKFCHNPAAFDADGDSLAYRLYTSSGRLSDVSNACATEFVRGYIKPETIGNAITETGTGPATLTVDPISGDICWDAPAEQGQYNIAFIIEEWRNGVKIGEIVRDMQIIVTPSTNRRPILQAPPDLCIEAGTLINQTIIATDPDNNRLELSAYGGPFNVGPDGQPLKDSQGRTLSLIPLPIATFTPKTAQNSPASSVFRWQTSCAHVRNESYDVILRVNDLPRIGQTQLATLDAFKIRIFAPQPKNLTARAAPATSQGRTITLTWDPYTCTNTPGLPNDVKMVIYRKEGCESLPPEACPFEAPPAGYTEVVRLPLNQTTYTDNNGGQGLKRGVQYSYVIAAVFPRPAGGRSMISQQVCVDLPQQVPVLTNVTVDSTFDNNQGRITVRWTRPLGINPNDLGGPFEYRLFRATGLNSSDFQLIATLSTTLALNTSDTTFIDRGLNTLTNAYRYRLEFFFTDPATGQLTRLDATEAASSVRLSATPSVRSLRLNWQALTPWSNDNQTHRIYRSQAGSNGPFNCIAEVPVTRPGSYSFTDTGADLFLADGNTSLALSVDSTYCYRVETVGSYNDSRIQPALLHNFSQGVCAAPIDTLKPCPPRLTIDSLACAELAIDAFCNQTRFTNNLSWLPGSGNGCDANVVQYKVYYSRYEQDSMHLLTSVHPPNIAYRHEGLSSFAGCYIVTAINRSGIESVPSNQVCKDNCPQLRLPNVLTPNGDGKNDVFQPLACPAFVEAVELAIYNRWGAKVYENTELVWNGKTKQGQELPAGLYYYQATVRFTRVNRNAQPEVYKGWLSLLKEASTK